MGYGCDKVPEVVNDYPIETKLEIQRRELLMQVEDNNVKKMSCEKEIENLENQIKEAENDIKLNQFQLKDTELKSRAKKILELKKDKDGIQRRLDSLTTMNETVKNNLENIQRKIDELRNINSLQKGNEVMKQFNKVNNDRILNDNINSLMEQKTKDERTKKMLERANKAYVGNDPNLNEDAILRNLLGNGI